MVVLHWEEVIMESTMGAISKELEDMKDAKFG